MAFVLDCSVTMAWVFPDEANEMTDRLRDSMIEGRAFVPSLWPIEVGNVLLVATRARPDHQRRLVPTSRNSLCATDRNRSDFCIPSLERCA